MLQYTHTHARSHKKVYTIEPNILHKTTLMAGIALLFFSFLFFYGHIHGMWEFLGQGTEFEP